MASSPKEMTSVEEKLKRMLAEETERRRKFSDGLQQLLAERNLQEASSEQVTVEEHTQRMACIDDTISAQLQDLCHVSRREKGSADANQERDSGYSASPATSADMDSKRRQAVLLRASAFTVLGPEEVPASRGLAEMFDRDSIPPGYTALEGHVAGEPTEHSDLSPQENAT